MLLWHSQVHANEVIKTSLSLQAPGHTTTNPLVGGSVRGEGVGCVGEGASDYSVTCVTQLP